MWVWSFRTLITPSRTSQNAWNTTRRIACRACWEALVGVSSEVTAGGRVLGLLVLCGRK
jgi:hypothetical protein